MAKRKNGNGIPRPTADDIRLATAIADAVGPRFEVMTSKLDEIKTELVEIKAVLRGHDEKLDDHGEKLDQLISGAVGVGRVAALEARVTALENKQQA